MQAIILTSDKSLHTLRGFFHQWQKYIVWPGDIVVCGFTPPDFDIPARFVSIGDFKDYPQNKWSNYLIDILADKLFIDIDGSDIADEVFFMTFDDFWLLRQTDNHALQIMYSYMHQFEYVLKFDVTTERLFAGGGSQYLFGNNTYNTLEYLDLIKSDFASAYHLSLWAGFWRRDLLRKVLVPNETAQQIELNGTPRLAQYGDEVLVLGTRQAPMRCGNVIQNGAWNQDAMVGIPALKDKDREELRELGYLTDNN